MYKGFVVAIILFCSILSLVIFNHYSNTEQGDVGASEFLSFYEVQSMLVRKGYYDAVWSRKPKTFLNKFELKIFNDTETIIDHATGLMWQKHGSDTLMNLKSATEYIINLNATKYAGFDDWRLPQLHEAMSLMGYWEKDNLASSG